MGPHPVAPNPPVARQPLGSEGCLIPEVKPWWNQSFSGCSPQASSCPLSCHLRDSSKMDFFIGSRIFHMTRIFASSSVKLHSSKVRLAQHTENGDWTGNQNWGVHQLKILCERVNKAHVRDWTNKWRLWRLHIPHHVGPNGRLVFLSYAFWSEPIQSCLSSRLSNPPYVLPEPLNTQWPTGPKTKHKTIRP